MAAPKRVQKKKRNYKQQLRFLFVLLPLIMLSTPAFGTEGSRTAIPPVAYEPLNMIIETAAVEQENAISIDELTTRDGAAYGYDLPILHYGARDYVPLGDSMAAFNAMFYIDGSEALYIVMPNARTAMVDLDAGYVTIDGEIAAELFSQFLIAEGDLYITVDMLMTLCEDLGTITAENGTVNADLLNVSSCELIASFKEGCISGNFWGENLVRYIEFYKKNPIFSVAQVLAYVNVGFDLPKGEAVEIADPTQMTALVNLQNALPRDYAPANVRTVSGYVVENETAEFYLEMQAQMKADIGKSCVIYSAYRSYDRQSALYRNYSARYGSGYADTFSAKPGHSEHQTGRAIDMLHKRGYSNLSSASFENTQQFEWLTKNAHNYGFILRYTEEGKQITGIMSEPWHWVYIGVDFATAYVNTGCVTYEEFYGKYICLNPDYHSDIGTLFGLGEEAVAFLAQRGYDSPAVLRRTVETLMRSTSLAVEYESEHGVILGGLTPTADKYGNLIFLDESGLVYYSGVDYRLISVNHIEADDSSPGLKYIYDDEENILLIKTIYDDNGNKSLVPVKSLALYLAD